MYCQKPEILNYILGQTSRAAVELNPIHPFCRRKEKRKINSFQVRRKKKSKTIKKRMFIFDPQSTNQENYYLFDTNIVAL